MIYEGKEKYIFVSYSHKDSAAVLPILNELMSNGYRVWYDSGIEAGTEWPEYIEDHLMSSHLVLVFMSPFAVESRNCRNEINFALELKKEMLIVYLEDTQLLKGMRLQLNSTQSIYRKNHPSDESFIQSLIRAKILQDCREEQGTSAIPIVEPTEDEPEKPEPPVVPPTPAPVAEKPKEKPTEKPAENPTPKSSDPKGSKKPLIIALAAALIIAIILICVFAIGGNDNGDSTTTSPDTTTTTGSNTTNPTTPRVPAVMSDELFDLTFELEGTVFQLPCAYEDLAAAGWTISSSTSPDKSVKAGGKESFDMSYNGKTIMLVAYNYGDTAAPLRECHIASFSWSVGDGADVKIAKGIAASSTMDEIIAAFGAPRQINEATYYTSLSYEHPSLGIYVSFYIYKDEDEKDSTYVTLKTSEPIGNGNAEISIGTVAMSDNLFDYTVEIDGAVFKFPCRYECFTDAGWTISSSGYTPDKIMGGDSSDSIRMSKDGKSITVYIYNKSGNALALRDCPIGGISDIEVGSGVSVELAKGITASSSVDDIISAFGTPSSRNDYSDYTSLTYQQNDSNENKIQFYCYKSTISKKYSSVSVKNFVVTEGDKTTTDPIAPPYLDTYNTPSVLGSDITSATISVGGDLYNLAAPVSEFVRNGWTIIEQPYFVAAGKTGEVTVSRNGTKLTLYITNFGYYQTTALNCAVHAVAVQTDDNIAMKLPGGIGIGSTKSAVQAAVTDDFRYYDGSSTEMWTYSDTKSDITIEITVDKSTSKVSRIRVFHEIWQ